MTGSVGLIVVSGVWRFYRDDYYKGPFLGPRPRILRKLFAEKGPDDVVSSLSGTRADVTRDMD